MGRELGSLKFSDCYFSGVFWGETTNCALWIRSKCSMNHSTQTLGCDLYAIATQTLGS